MITRLSIVLTCAVALRPPPPASRTPPTRLQAAAGEWQQCERRFAVRGPVAKGYGRGGKKLGFATANLDSDVIGDVLGDLEKGVYAAFYQTAKTTEPLRAVVNVGVALTPSGSDTHSKARSTPPRIPKAMPG